MVLQGFPTVRELIATGVRSMVLDDTLFRTDKLIDRTPQVISPPPTNVGVIGMASTTTSVTSTTATTMSAKAASSNGAATTASPATSSSSTPAAAPAATPTYARAITSASPPPQITLPVQPRPANSATRQQPPKPAPWNPGPRGLDPPLQVSQSALEAIKKRKDSNKLCNNHYLRGPCSKGDACCFEHKYKPTKDEIVAIAFLTRLNPCENGQDCQVENCIYGHHVSTNVSCQYISSLHLTVASVLVLTGRAFVPILIANSELRIIHLAPSLKEASTIERGIPDYGFIYVVLLHTPLIY